MALREFKLPDPGEGLTEAELVTWHVAVGDTVKVNDIVVEVETAKSLVELPVPFAGTVSALHVAEGDTVEVGTPIITIDDGLGGSAGCRRAGSRGRRGSGPASERHRRQPARRGGDRRGARSVARRRPGAPPCSSATASSRPRPSAAPARAAAEPPSPAPADRRHRPSARPRPPQRPPGARARALAKPPVRKLAKDLGVDLASLTPSGDGGVVTRADVEAAASRRGPPPESERPRAPAAARHRRRRRRAGDPRARSRACAR